MTIAESGAKIGALKSTGTPLNVAQRKAGAEYHHEITSPLSGLDLASNEGTIDKSRFWDLRNFRIDSPGSITVRTGIKEHAITIRGPHLI